MSRLAFTTSTAIQSGALIGAAETGVAISPAISGPFDSAMVLIFWYVALNNLGTGTTGVVVRIRRGITVAGALVNVGSPHTAAAGQAFALGGSYVDTVAGVAGVQYILTAQQNGASTNCNVGDVFLLAMIL